MRPIGILRPYAPSKTLRALASARAREAVGAMLRFDWESFGSFRDDVKRLRAEARRAEDWEAADRNASDHRKKIIAGVNRVLDLTDRVGNSAARRGKTGK